MGHLRECIVAGGIFLSSVGDLELRTERNYSSPTFLDSSIQSVREFDYSKRHGQEFFYYSVAGLCAVTLCAIFLGMKKSLRDV